MVTVITTIFGDHHLLEHFVNHYCDLGVDRILVLVNSWNDMKLPSDLPSMVEVVGEYSQFCTGIHLTSRENEVIRNRCDPSDPVIYADLDELYTYPKPLLEMVSDMSLGKFDFVMGRFADRVTSDGSIPQHIADNIWEQFPFQTDLTAKIIKVLDTKVLLNRACMGINAGHHSVVSEYRYIRYRESGIAHHFKWQGQVVERVKTLKSIYEADGKPNAVKMQLLLDWLGDPPRIKLEDLTVKTL